MTLQGVEKKENGVDAAIQHWDPTAFLREAEHGEQQQQQQQIALVVINTPIVRLDIFARVWSRASLRYCADGGANRLLEAFGKDAPNFLPTLIKGDLDSLKAETRAYYESKGVEIIQDDDLYSTDLGKCIESLVEVEQTSGKKYQLIIYGGLSGRLDQTAHTLHALLKLRKVRSQTWLLSEESLTCVLDKGKHALHQPQDILGPTCGILPIGVDSACVTTSGLRWNLEHSETSMDGMLSTSNHFASDHVAVETDKPIIWTAELRPAR